MATKSDYAYYPKLWQKSFLIEIVRRDNQQLYTAFAFSVPPESVSTQIPQRVNVKKTFGGTFVDDYGIDTMPISIKGSTGNAQFKEIYWVNSTRYVDGKNEALLILNEILQYKEGLEEYDKYEMRLFDLSSIAEAITGSMLSRTESVDAIGWKVILKGGKIERSKDKPYFYNYDMDFLALEPIGKKRPFEDVSAGQFSAIEDVIASLDTTKKKAKSLKQALADYRSVIDKIKLVEEMTDNLESQARSFYRTVQGFVDMTADGINSVFEIIAFPFDLAQDLVKGARDIRASVENVFLTFFNGIQDIQSRPEIIATLLRDLFDLEESVASVSRAAKGSGAMPEVHIVPSSFRSAQLAINAADESVTLDIGYVLTYGYMEIIATSETRLDVLSNQVYGTPDYADLIGKYNAITGDSDIVPGMKIRIPYLSYAPALRNSEVYSYGTEPYGSDIALSGNGDLQLAEYNDYAITDGLSNIQQAINLRLGEDQGTRVRLDAYGIKQSRGSFDPFSLAVLISSIKDTLVQDSRIKSAYGFKLQQDEDSMVMDFDI